MSDGFEIKRLEPGDLSLAKELFLSFQLDDGVENPTFAPDEYLTKLLEKDDFHIIVAIKDERVVGGLTAYELLKYKAEKTEMFLYEIGVESAYRKRGAASCLIEALKEICREKNIKTVFVLTEAGNLPARSLYEKTGGKGFAVVEFDYELE
jgi:aminoglycoside 3-N-acetyltransferase I